MHGLICFVAVEFVDDENVRGLFYWYECKFENVKIGDRVTAPLGRHNREQAGTVRLVRFAEAKDAPFPYHYIKSVTQLIQESDSV